MSDNELEIDYKWKSAHLEKEKQSLILENKRLQLEISTLHKAIANLFERLSSISVNWFPPHPNEDPTHSSLSSESADGTLNSVITLCERDPSLLKKFSDDIGYLFVDILLFLVQLRRTKSTFSIFSCRRDATQTQRQTTKIFKKLHCLRLLLVAHLKQQSSSSNPGLT
jgi:hypothetical protein